MTILCALRLPIDWTALGWPAHPEVGGVVLATGDPEWSWDPAVPAFAVRTMAIPDGEVVPDFTLDHVVLLVPDLDRAVSTLDRVGVEPRLRMRIPGDRRAAFFRVGTVLEVIEAPVRQASLYGVAVATSRSLESLALAWRALGLDVGDIKPVPRLFPGGIL